MASMYSGVMEGSGEEVAAWLTSPAFESRLFTSFPCTNIIPSAANQVLHPSVAASLLPALCTSWSAFASFVAHLPPLLLLDLIFILFIRLLSPCKTVTAFLLLQAMHLTVWKPLVDATHLSDFLECAQCCKQSSAIFSLDNIATISH